jgi:hypothetical protein
MGTQLSVCWAVAQAAESLAASRQREERDAGRALRCCEVVRLDKVGAAEREPGGQGVRVALRFYCDEDRAAVAGSGEVAPCIARAMGLWADGAVQLDLGLLADDGAWLGIRRPYQRGGTGLRLDRYLTREVLERLNARQGSEAWRDLAERPGEVRILLRRLRYRFGEDYGAGEGTQGYAFWTTKTTRQWSTRGGHRLEYLVHRLSHWSDVLTSGNADPADSLDPGYWGEVDTEEDPLRIGQLTTRSGVTKHDVRAVLDHAGAQIQLLDAETSRNSAPADPTAFFVGELTDLLESPEWLRQLDVLLVHRGGGVEGRINGREVPVAPERKEELLDLCRRVRDLGVEVVVALGHADLSVLRSRAEDTENLPLGVFETTTPTAGAAWILKEHINPRLVDSALIYSQPLDG